MRSFRLQRIIAESLKRTAKLAAQNTANLELRAAGLPTVVELQRGLPSTMWNGGLKTCGVCPAGPYTVERHHLGETLLRSCGNPDLYVWVHTSDFSREVLRSI
jgi:hypothetical protein